MEGNERTPAASGGRAPDSGRNETDDQISLLDLAVVVAENIRLLLLGPLLAGLLALGVAFLIPPTFTARTSLLPPAQPSAIDTALSQFGAVAGAAVAAVGLKNPADQYVALLGSATVANRLVDRFKLMEQYGAEVRQDALTVLRRRTAMSAGKDGLIVVEVEDESPQGAANIANAYVRELEAILGRIALTEAQQRRVFFEKQLEQSRHRLTAAELALATTGVGAGAIRAHPQATVDAVARLHAQVAAQEVKLAAMRGYLTESSPEFRQAQAELAALRSQLRKSEAGEASASLPGSYIEKYREFKYEETLFQLYVRQFELAKVDEAGQGAAVQVVDVALPPERKSGPRRAWIATLTALATGMVLLLWLLVRKAVADSAVRPDQAGKLAAVRAGFSRLFVLRQRRN